MKQLSHWMSILVFVGLTLSLPTQARTTLLQSPAIKEAGKQQGEKYPTVDMHRSKLRQDKSEGVIYLDARQREERRVSIQNGLVYDYLGKPLLTSTSKHHNRINYVMDAAGNFYLFDEFTHPEIRHSSIFAGGAVAGAGNIEIAGGRIVYIDSDSGHYPAQGALENVHKELAARGVSIGDRKAARRSESRAESKEETKAESKAESKADSKADGKARSRADSKTDSEAVSKVDTKADSKADRKAGHKKKKKNKNKNKKHQSR